VRARPRGARKAPVPGVIKTGAALRGRW
jgi:hypothetical protein